MDLKTNELNEGNINSKVNSTFELLSEGEKQIHLSEKYKDLVLVLGNTGSGKSTFVQWIAGNNDELISVEVKKNSGEFVIIDHNRISNSTIKSKTIFPELQIDAKTNTAFYDCPGFSDTRSTTLDIASTYFIKKLIDHAKSLKLIFLISHPSVRKGVDRQDFMMLMKHATDLIKDIDKYKNSISIIATKVDNTLIKQGKNYILVSDDVVIGAIADFIQEVKMDLRENLKHSSIYSKENKFYTNVMKIIDLLLDKKNNEYFKIGIFRRPDELGQISKIALLQEGKQKIVNIIHKKLNFTVKGKDDFGYTLSDRSKIEIHDLVEEINRNVWSNAKNITKKVELYYHGLLEQVQTEIKSVFTSTYNFENGELGAQAFSSKVNSGTKIISSLIKDLQNKSIEEFSVQINSAVTSLGIQVPEHNVLNIANGGKYLAFLQLVNNKKLNLIQWGELFNDTLAYLFESKRNIQLYVEEKARYINEILSESSKSIHKHYDEKMNILEIQRLPDELNDVITVIGELKQRVDNMTPSTELSEVIQKTNFQLRSLGLNINKSHVRVIVNRYKYLNFLQALSDVNLKSETLPWTCPLEDSISYLSQSLNWYKYLNSLNSKLSEYKIQKSKRRYDVTDLNDWGKDDKPQGITILPNNFKTFLGKTAEFNIKEYNSIKTVNTTELKIEELNNVLNLGLKQGIHLKCEEPYIFIMGQFVNVEDIKNNSNVCLGTSTDKRYKFINIFALNTVFIDQQLSFSGLELAITIIAPKWKVIGSREIDLHGAEGKKGNVASSDSPWYAICSGRDGLDGIPGEPGGPGGSFFGMAEQIINGDELTITTSGGDGGPGADGEEGTCGKVGISASEPEHSPCQDIECYYSTKCRNISYKSEYTIPTTGRAPVLASIRTDTYVMEFFGEPGIIGGKGGDGGRGGEGGEPGDIILYELYSTSGVLKQNNSGKQGKAGVGGKGGKEGENGDGLVMSCERIVLRTILSAWNDEDVTITWRREKTIEGIYLGTRGNGADGTNDKNLKSPKSANIIKPTTIINKYKQYLRNNLNNRLNKYPLINFLNLIDSNNDVISIYDTLGFVGELQGLESQFHNLKSVDLLPSYESLLKRISKYARRPEQTHKSLEQKNVLRYLYTAILGRILNLKDNLDSNLIINVTEYIDSIKYDLDALKDLQNYKKKYDVIKKYKNQYENKFFLKVEEAKNVIDNDILPEMEKVGEEIGTRLQSLIDEVKDSKDKTEKEKEDLIEKRKTLEKYMVLHEIFGFLNIFTQTLSVLGPAGMIVGSAVSLGSTVADTTLLMTEVNPEINLLKLQKGVSDLETIKIQINSIRDKKFTEFQKLLDHTLEEIEKDSETFGEVRTKVSEIKDKLSKESEKEFSFIDFKKVDNLKKELMDALGSKEVELKKYQQNPKKRHTIVVIEKLKKTIGLSTAAAETLIMYKNDRAKLDEVNKAIAAATNKLNKLKEYEHNIYTAIAPMLQNVTSGINDIQSKLGTKSKISLDITKWMVQTTLSDMKLQIRLLTEEFKSKDNLVRSIGKLGDAVTTLIGVYDHIQDFQDQQTLAVYIADINSAAPDEIDIGNQELRDAVRKLEITIRSSIVLQRYKVAVDAFKQYVFPFAHTYFKDIELPTNLGLDWNEGNNALENLVQKAQAQIDHIKSIQNNYKLSINEADSYIGTGEFNSRFLALKPFYTWKNELHKNMISKLLSGQEVVVYADITNSVPDKDAIKFKVIDFQFKARNETMQSKINKVLEGFEVSATHQGNSYYLYNNVVYVITTNSIPIWYYFKKDNNGPVHKGRVYDKIKDGEFMLSPYASWKIKLTNLTTNISFDNLEIFKDDIDLELGGFGHYINKRKINDIYLKVDKYYTVVDTLDQNELVEEEDTISLVKHDESSKNKREVGQLLENYVHSTHEQILEMENTATNSGVHMLSPINSVFNWFKTRSIALVLSFVPMNILDYVQTVYETYNRYNALQTPGHEPSFTPEEFQNHSDCYSKFKVYGAVVNGWDLENENCVDNKDYVRDYLKPQVIEPTGDENTNVNTTAEAVHNCIEYGPDCDFSNAPLVEMNVIRNYSSCIGASECNYSILLPSAERCINNSKVFHSLEGWGSLILADVMIRSINKEKYEQACFIASSPALEKTIELHHLDQKVKSGLRKMSFLFGGHEVEDWEFSPEV